MIVDQLTIGVAIIGAVAGVSLFCLFDAKRWRHRSGFAILLTASVYALGGVADAAFTKDSNAQIYATVTDKYDDLFKEAD